MIEEGNRSSAQIRDGKLDGEKQKLRSAGAKYNVQFLRLLLQLLMLKQVNRHSKLLVESFPRLTPT